MKNGIHGSLLVFTKSPYLLYYIILRLSMSMAVQFITILCCVFCAIYTSRSTQVPHREAPVYYIYLNVKLVLSIILATSLTQSR